MSFVVKLRRKIQLLLPIKNVIVFESAPDVSGNSKAVFDEMLRRKLNDKYKLVWFIKDKRKCLNIKNVYYYSEQDFWGHFKIFQLKLRAKCFISENDFLITSREGQVSFYLSHGAHIKSSRDYYTVPIGIDYCIALSEGLKKIYSYELRVNPKNIYALGYPRNDVLVNSPRLDLREVFQKMGHKLIVWYPTYRQSKNSDFNGMQPLPLIKNESDAKAINDMLVVTNTVLIIKPHFAQNLEFFKVVSFSNIIFIDDDFFVQNKLTSYELVANCDALISDYSSIYYDYLVCDKPIALIWEDIELYKANPGLIQDYEKYCAGAKKIYNLKGLESFISDVANGVDSLKYERKRLVKDLGIYTDGKSAGRVTDFIIKQAGL